MREQKRYTLVVIIIAAVMSLFVTVSTFIKWTWDFIMNLVSRRIKQ